MKTLVVLDFSGVDPTVKRGVCEYLQAVGYTRVLTQNVGFEQSVYVKGYLPENVWVKESDSSQDQTKSEHLEIKKRFEELGLYSPTYFFNVYGSPLGDWLVERAAEL